ncbi:peptide-methionine (S)-S-oxide reductase MsrA [Melaminivora alkalimesophila]|uniref:Peptide methionine sulfoxide reductase MsrA n=1 Tax=Melaminivora alkalimesophila TaxID=1165852 RepID=A0A317RBI0_9BURK|nr:peptide-methionine (S)-S-oxide reductase MsrA [Melaminivora alkalimesophila]PWW46299.1 peptide-methionine (S)-S-oxide reductase [Melaminivora alkalimesophila]
MSSPEQQIQTITLGGGCFWCTEAVFRRVRGVHEVQSGYANGHVAHPSYEQVCRGDTGHAEVVRVRFDPQEISVGQILEIFFATHDPTTPNRQGNDVGPQYRSAIYYSDEAHRQVAEEVLRRIEREGLFDAPVVTELQPLQSFWPAEDYHGRYYDNNPSQGYCAFVIAPKLEKFRQTFREHLKPGA